MFCFSSVLVWLRSGSTLRQWEPGLVLPFAGLEFAVLVAGFYLSALVGHTREVIGITGPVLRVLRGRRYLEEVASLPANWTRVELRRDPCGWYPSRLLLCCHGRRFEVGAKLVETEREELAGDLDDKVGFLDDKVGFDRPGTTPSAAGTVTAGMARAGCGRPWDTLRNCRNAIFQASSLGNLAGSGPMSGAALGSARAQSSGRFCAEAHIQIR